MSIALTLLFVTLEAVLCTLIINKVPYTEIDWIAYMQEVEGWLKNNQTNYALLKGQTGPLVYPGGFMYLFGILYEWTDEGKDIKKAQWVFMGLYLLGLFLVLEIYRHLIYKPEKTLYAKIISVFVMGLLCCSKRLHSIYLLRLFNDPVAITFVYFGLYLFMYTKSFMILGILLSFGIGVKMNVLLLMPVFGVFCLKSQGLFNTFLILMQILLLQIVFGFPFLSTFPLEYLNGSFDFSRQFLYKWTVNWKFIPEELFLNAFFSKILLFGHLLTLLIMTHFSWLQSEGGLISFIRELFRGRRKSQNDFEKVFYGFCVSMLIGIFFSRSLHYQFYSWYAWMIPFILYQTRPYKERLADIKIFIFQAFYIGSLWLMIECCWLIYPANFYSSLVLWICHFIILIRIISDTITDHYKHVKTE